MYPTRARISQRSATTSRPRTRADPASGRRSVVSKRKSVVLPAPSGPMTPKISPLSTAKETPSRATVSPKLFARASTSTAACADVAGKPDEDEAGVARFIARSFRAPPRWGLDVPRFPGRRRAGDGDGAGEVASHRIRPSARVHALPERGRGRFLNEPVRPYRARGDPLPVRSSFPVPGRGPTVTDGALEHHLAWHADLDPPVRVRHT